MNTEIIGPPEGRLLFCDKFWRYSLCKEADKRALSVIADISPERIVYVSCDPASLARDLAYLQERGYKAVEVQPVDMFPWKALVESVALIDRI